MPATLANDPAASHRIVELCYRYAYLEGRRRVHPLDPVEANELLSMRTLLVGDSFGPRRRAHRRFPIRLGGALKGAKGWCTAVVLDMSADGLYVAIPRGMEVGSTVQVRLTTESGAEYLFTGTVVRRSESALFEGLGLSLCCVPLEMRRRRAALSAA